MRDGRLLKKRTDSLAMVGMTMLAKTTIKPTTRTYESAIEKPRLLLGKMLANFLMSGEIAKAKKSAAKMISRPKLALYKR